MKLLKWIALAIAIIVIVVAAAGLSLPRRFQVVRDITIDAPPDEIFPVIARLREWPTWSPWPLDRYPDADRKEMYSGPEEGVGANLRWVGKATGVGRLEITKAEVLGGIDYAFEFERQKSTGGIMFFPGPDGTLVAWHFEGDLGYNPFSRLVGRHMDQVIGKDLETGLQNLKTKVEKPGSKAVLPQLQDVTVPTTPATEVAEPR